jgi:energy-coupling factor transporter ATP-binding protein EcfA2
VAAGLYPENGGFLESGIIRLYGQDLKTLDPQKRAAYLTVLFQNPDLQFCMNTLREEMRFCLENICIPAGKMDERIGQAAAELGIGPLLDQPLSTLSGGEKQKAALSCLYVMESRCILLDESFANLDHEAAIQLLEMLLRMKASGRTILAIDHKADLWLEAADEIILLEEGGRVAARSINCKNLPEYRADFERLGLFYPGSRSERTVARPAEGKPLLQFRGVSIRKGLPIRRKWGRPVYDAPFLVQNTDADFPAGCMTAVLGPSGTGKTTTFLSVLKQHPYTGQILFQGRDIEKMKPQELYRHIGIVFQNPANQFVTQNVEDEVCVGLRLWEPGLSDEACCQRAEELLDRYGLKRQRRYSPYMLSQGQQRRLAVLSVLAGGQELLLLDEPTYGQDSRSVNAIMEHLREKVEQEGLTVIFITHDTELAAVWADKIYRLEDTMLVESSAEEVL